MSEEVERSRRVRAGPRRLRRVEGDGDSLYAPGVRRGVSGCVAAAVAAVVVSVAQSASPPSPVFEPARLVGPTHAPGGLPEIATAALTGDGIPDVLVTNDDFQNPAPQPVTILVGDGAG